MKIVKVKIKHFKCLDDFEASFDGDVVLIKGDNGLGKSSAIQFIEIALGKNTNIPPNAKGEGEVVTLKNGEQYIFKVKFDKDGKAKLEVTKPDGLRDTTKGAIREIVGAVDFDANNFVDLSKSEKGRKQQIEEFKRRLPMEIQKDLEKWEKDIKACFEERTGLGHDLKRAKGALESHPLYNALVWKDNEHQLKEGAKYAKLSDYVKVDISAVFTSMQKAQEHNSLYDRAMAKRESLDNDVSNYFNEVRDLKAKLKIAEKNHEASTANLKKADEWLAAKENQLIDLSDYETRVNQANEVNEHFDEVQSLKKHITDKEELESNVGELTARIESNRSAISDAVKETASIVMEGMSFDEDNLLYNDIPVNPDSMSTSEIMELGVRMKYAENPEAPLFIQRTESIGAKRWETIMAFAKDHGMQIIGEEVIRGQEKLTIEISAA